MLKNAKSRRFLALGAILLAAACVRFATLGKQGLFLDEASSWAATYLSFPDLLSLSFGSAHPTFYFIFLKFFLLGFPSSEFGLRAFSAGVSIVSLAAVLMYVSSRWKTETMVYVGLLMSLSSFDVYYAQDARMYTLLALLWVGSYISLVRTLEGDRVCRVVWPITTILMAWTHLYGVLAAFTHVVFLVGYLLLEGRSQADRQQLKNGRSLLVGAACIALGILPPLAFAFRRSPQGAGGAWIPGPQDLQGLFLLWSTGLSAARAYFLDSRHLVLPLLAGLSTKAWIAVGVAIGGLPAMWGLFHTWRTKNGHRAEVLLSIWLIALPVALAYGYAAIMKQRVWALKPFLGSAYLFYLWAGIGIGSLKPPLLRRCLGVAIVVVAIVSLWPYFTTWQKDNTAKAFHSMPTLTDRDGILISSIQMAPLVFYYTSEIVPVYSLVPQDGEYKLVQVLRLDRNRFGLYEEISCEDLSSTTSLWVYRYDAGTREDAHGWPACVTSKKLWGFRQGEWQRVEP